MFGMGAQEIALIAIVLILVVGPDDLPGMLRTMGRWIGNVQSLARDFRRQIDTMADDAGLAEERKLFGQARNLRPRNLVKEALDPSGEISQGLDQVDREAREASAALQSPGKLAQDLWKPTVAPGAKGQARQRSDAQVPGAKTTKPQTARPKIAKPKASQAKSSEPKSSGAKTPKHKKARPQAARPTTSRAPGRTAAAAPSRARKAPSRAEPIA